MRGPLQNTNLRYRARDANTNGEVSTLQDFLQSKKLFRIQNLRDIFGILTLKAVKDFQKDNNINPTGYVGAVTRAKIANLTGCDGTIISPPNPTTPSITVLSPNGGEKYETGQNYNITWNSVGVEKMFIFIYQKRGDVNGVVSLIGDNILASLGNYSWTIPVNNSDINKGGQFKIVISKNGSSNVFDNSDNYFTITSSGDGCSNGEVYSPTTGHKCSTPIISSVSGPQTLNVNQTGTWTVNASIQVIVYLSYSVDWGENVYGVVNNEYKANSAYISKASYIYSIHIVQQEHTIRHLQ